MLGFLLRLRLIVRYIYLTWSEIELF
jgi:hypothetical protein